MSPKYLSKYNKFRISNLFFETTNRDYLYVEGNTLEIPVFTLGTEDTTDSKGNKLISMHKKFLESGDVTGYDFAIEVLGSYEHFVCLEEHRVIGKHIESWKREIKAKLDSKALKEIERISKEGGSQAELSAAKFLIKREYEEKGSVGKPATNNSTRKAGTHARETSRDTKAEMERLGLTTH